MARAFRNPNLQGPFGNTLLHSAVVAGDSREVERLLAAGADPAIANREGNTAFDAAVLFGHTEIYALLVSRACPRSAAPSLPLQSPSR